MRPLTLKLKGFTAFRDEQVIDFTDLDLFVLWGPTGSGKSSLLDAMTYALFGYVERVGNQISQLVSHGQPRLSVSLEFAIGDRAYKVTRSTSSGSQSKALLERREGDGWESYGEGADSVREVNRTIPGLLGLDYEAFTRSVILPQGRFAEFLTGDPAKRREILTELLGLELFRRMSQRSNEIAKNAKLQLDTKTELLGREYAGVDADALRAAEGAHKDLTETLQAAQALEKKLAAIETRWNALEASRKALAGCATEVHDAADVFLQAAVDLDSHAKNAKEATTKLAEAQAAAKDAERALAEATKKRATAEGKTGSLEDLAALRAKAGSLDEARDEHAAAVESLAEAEKEAQTAAAAVKKEATSLTAAKKSHGAAVTALEEAQAAHDAAHAKEGVGALVAGLEPGDPCPVCDRPLESIPKAARKEIQAAKKALETTRKAEKDAGAAVGKAETAHAVALERTDTAKQGVARCKKEAGERKKRVESMASEIAALAGKARDPVVEIDKRIAELRGLIAAQDAAGDAADKARAELGRRELAASRLQAEMGGIKARVTGIRLVAMCARVAEAADVDVPDLLAHELPDAVEDLAAVAATTGKELEKLAQELSAQGAARAGELEALSQEARDALPEGVALDVAGLEAVVKQARATVGELTTEAAMAKKAAADLAAKLETKQRYEEEIATHGREHAIYSALGKELKSDRIVQFLQAEALAALAYAASAHLQELSSTRYRLEYEDDRFFVVDAWNGDERRSVRTLSGGETFQASLALALALSEQVQFLAVTERNRLDSLFLDEGFGTLDADTLEVVVNAIEQLGGDGRLVGVITHVPELANRIPVRFEVAKSQRGSTLQRADAELIAGLV